MNLKALLEHLGCPYRSNTLLKAYSSWRIGGLADWIVEPVNTSQVSEILRFCLAVQLPILIIGHGTNLLFDDAGFRGVIIRIANNMSTFTIDGFRIQAQAGVWVPQLALAVGRAGLSGLEHTIGIPGTVGGLVAMNGGSQRKAIGNCVERVRIVDHTGNGRSLSREECRFAYRTSFLQKGGFIVADVELGCEPGDPRAIRREMLSILRDRRRKFPRKQPNCGSVFVSGGEMYRQFGPPGKVIEDAGLKGLRVGDAQVSEQHANFITNLGNASSWDTLNLIRLIREEVHRGTGLWLECEVRYVRPNGAITAASDVFEPMPNGASQHRSHILPV
ncbi:MAG: UDP-N-acetylmuramate dehydrogenase [Pirellulaceae bacterium]